MKLIYALIAAVLLLTGSPAIADTNPDRRERAERPDRAPSPYSNRTQARKRELREAIREAAKDDSDHYRFRRTERRPERDD